MTLTTIDNIRQELRVDSQGRGWVSIRGAARLAGVDESTLRKAFEGAGLNRGKLAQFLTQQGLEVRGYSLDGIPDVALVHLLEYFAFHATRTNENSKSLSLLNFRSISAVGARTLIRQACGWNDQAPVLTKEQKIAEALLLVHADLVAAKETIAILEPKADKYDCFLNTEGLTTVGEFAKELGIKGLGQNNMFKRLRELGFICQNTTMPYQKWVDRGYFIVRSVETPIGSIPQTHITKKGVELLLSQLT